MSHMHTPLHQLNQLHNASHKYNSQLITITYTQSLNEAYSFFIDKNYCICCHYCFILCNTRWVFISLYMSIPSLCAYKFISYISLPPNHPLWNIILELFLFNHWIIKSDLQRIWLSWNTFFFAKVTNRLSNFLDICFSSRNLDLDLWLNCGFSQRFDTNFIF